MLKTKKAFEWVFSLMEGPNRIVNIMFILIGAAGVIYWLSQQTKYNKEAEKNGTVK